MTVKKHNIVQRSVELEHCLNQLYRWSRKKLHKVLHNFWTSRRRIALFAPKCLAEIPDS